MGPGPSGPKQNSQYTVIQHFDHITTLQTQQAPKALLINTLSSFFSTITPLKKDLGVKKKD